MAVLPEKKTLVATLNIGQLVDQASAAAFWLFLSIVPIATVAGMVAAKVTQTNFSLLHSIVDQMPPASRDLLETEVARVGAWNGGAVGPISAVTFVWLASSGIHAILDAFDVTTDTERSWVRKRIISIVICIAMSIGIAMLGVIAALVLRGAIAALAMTPPLRIVLALSIEALAIFALFLGGLGREGRSRVRHLFPGAFFAAGFHFAASFGYVQYIRHAGDGGAYLAGLATIAITMTFVWVFAFSLLAGLVLNKVLGLPVVLDARERAMRRLWRKWHV
jgi:membrane protein